MKNKKCPKKIETDRNNGTYLPEPFLTSQFINGILVN